MSVLVALALASGAAGQVAAIPAAEPEITVMARKLKNWRGHWQVRKGKVTCKTKRSTGDREIDAIGCAALMTCLGSYASELEAISDTKDDRKTKNAKVATIFGGAMPCVEAEHAKGIAALAERRAGQ